MQRHILRTDVASFCRLRDLVFDVYARGISLKMIDRTNRTDEAYCRNARLCGNKNPRLTGTLGCTNCSGTILFVHFYALSIDADFVVRGWENRENSVGIGRI